MQGDIEEFGTDGPGGGQLILDLDGYEGPIDVLLALAREQKVDLTKISILQLADQYLEFVARARRLSLELAADYLVMAAWLAYLKSRLLLPEPAGEGEPTGPQLAAALAFQLRRLEAMQQAGARLVALPRLGRDFFPRGAPEGIEVTRQPVVRLKLYDLLKGYAAVVERERAGPLYIAPSELYSVDEALKRLSRMLGQAIEWRALLSFLPAEPAGGGLRRRSVLAATLTAGLELVRAGAAEMRQDRLFGPIYLRRNAGAP